MFVCRPGSHTTLVFHTKRHGNIPTGDDNEMFMTRSLNVMPRQQNSTSKSDKSVAYVTNNKRLLDI